MGKKKREDVVMRCEYCGKTYTLKKNRKDYWDVLEGNGKSLCEIDRKRFTDRCRKMGYIYEEYVEKRIKEKGVKYNKYLEVKKEGKKECSPEIKKGERKEYNNTNKNAVKPGDLVGPYNITCVNLFLKFNGNKWETFGSFKCPKCGDIFETHLATVKSGKITGCGKHKADFNYNRLQIDISEELFDTIKPLNPTIERKGSSIVWDCICIECGEKIKASVKELKEGKRCECIRKKEKDVSGQIYWDAVEFIEPLDEEIKHDTLWKCKCLLCGDYFNTKVAHVKNKWVTSCGCRRQSVGAQKIENVLKANNISFVKEKRFKDCIDKYQLPFDFYVNDSYIIEYDGQQHYIPIDYWGGDNGFELGKKHDEIKNEFCRANNIPIIRIPYTHEDIVLEDLIPETSKYLV